MKRIKIIFILALVGILLVGCKSKEARVQEQLDLGSKYMSELDYESAIVALNKAIKIDPKNVDAYKMLAEVYEKSGRLDDARATLEKVLDLDDLSSDNEDEINDRIKNLDFLVAISKLPGEYDEPTALELSNTGLNDIYYSIDTKDSRLVATDMKYTSPILLDEDGSYILKAYTVDSGGNKHDSTEVKYTIKLSKEHVEKDSWESVGNIYRYRGKDGKIVTGWQQIDGSWYYFKENGDMATGVADINGVKYCFDEDGVMLTGWKQIDGKWYYFGDDGAARSGSQTIDGKQYYFGDDGAMLIGWQQIDGKWYYISDSGELSTGWKEIDGKWYYFASNGEMKTDQYIDGYYVGADGVRTNESIRPKTNDVVDIKKLYRDALTTLYSTGKLGSFDESEYGDNRGSYDYELIDVNGDGIDDLIVSESVMTVHGDVEIFSVVGGQLKSIFKHHILSMTGLSNYAIYVEEATHGTTPYAYYEYDKSNNVYKLVRDGYTGDDGGRYDDTEDQAFLNSISKYTSVWDYGINEGIEVTPENIAKIK